MRLKHLFVLALLCSIAGCYTYVPVEGPFPDRGREVRVLLSPTQDIDLGPITVRDVARVDGTVYRATPDTLAISSQWFHTQLRQRHYTNGHIHVLLRNQAADVEVRKFHIGFTVLATAAIIAAGTAVFAFTTDLGGGGIGEPGDGDTQGSIVGVIPIFSIPIP